MTAASPGAARYVGQRVARKEDRRLLSGNGTYVDDVVLPGMLEAAFVRSTVARARIRSINTELARLSPGVRAIYTAKDFTALGAKLYNIHAATVDEAEGAGPVMAPLAIDDVRYVGDPVVLIVADNRYLAEDAAELVEIDYEIQQPVLTCAQARTGSPVHPNLDSNLAGEAITPPDPELDEIFARAAHVVTDTIRHQRQTHVPMETRGLVASRTGAGELTVHLSCQSPHQSARYFAKVFNLADSLVRVLAKDVGGAFGQKTQPGRDELAVVAATLLLHRPIKWIEDRVENLTASLHTREQEVTVRLAFDKDGRLLGADLEYEGNIGAYPQAPDTGAFAMMMFPGPYRLAKVGYRSRGYYTNTCGWGFYRGPWMMESLARETMLDVAARQIGIDAQVLRQRNLIRADEQPFSMAPGFVLERITPQETFALVLGRVEVPRFRIEQAAARKEGRYLGLGTAVYVEPTTMAFPSSMATEVAQVRVETTGKVVALMSTHSQGHSNQTTLAQVVADELGVDIADVTIVEGDSLLGGFGAGAGGSRQAVAGGGAAKTATALVREKIRRIAAHLLNASPDSVQIRNGEILVAGVAEMTTSLRQIAEVAYFDPDRLPPGMEPGLECQFRYRPPPIVFSNASHACIVEVDVDTGLVKILRWVASEDCGVMINPSVVEGQIAGGVVQGIGGVLYEHATYDDSGNPTAVTFKDYLMPLASDVPLIEYLHIETPSDTPGGFKGVGEGGAIIAPPTLVNAIADALAPFNARCLDLPLSPDRILRLIAATDDGDGHDQSTREDLR